MDTRRTRNYTFVGSAMSWKFAHQPGKSGGREGRQRERERLMDAVNTKILTLYAFKAICAKNNCVPELTPSPLYPVQSLAEWKMQQLEAVAATNDMRKICHATLYDVKWFLHILFPQFTLKLERNRITRDDNEHSQCMVLTTAHGELDSPFQNEKGWKIVYNKFALNGQWKWWMRSECGWRTQQQHISFLFRFVYFLSVRCRSSVAVCASVCVWRILRYELRYIFSDCIINGRWSFFRRSQCIYNRIYSKGTGSLPHPQSLGSNRTQNLI